MKLYYPFEIIVIRGGMDETFMELTPECFDVIKYSRSRMTKHTTSTPQNVTEDHIKLLMRECDMSRNDAEDALRRTDDDLYLAAVDAMCT